MGRVGPAAVWVYRWNVHPPTPSTPIPTYLLHTTLQLKLGGGLVRP